MGLREVPTVIAEARVIEEHVCPDDEIDEKEGDWR